MPTRRPRRSSGPPGTPPTWPPRPGGAWTTKRSRRPCACGRPSKPRLSGRRFFKVYGESSSPRGKAAQAQAVADHEERGTGHRGPGDDRVEQGGGGQRKRGDVVGERPEEIALDRAQRRAREPDGVADRAKVTADKRDVGGLDRGVGAGRERDPEVGLGERGRVVDPVADH